MRLQRRLFVIYTVCFLMFMILCNCKLVSFFSNINTDKKTKIERVSGRLYSLISCDSPCIIISRVWQSSSYNSNFYEMLIKQMSLQPTYTLSQKKSVICSAWWLYLFCAILDFDRNNLYSHFCFSELLILREKRGLRIFIFKCRVNVITRTNFFSFLENMTSPSFPGKNNNWITTTAHLNNHINHTAV